MDNHSLAGVYAAAVTPLKRDYSPDLDAIPELLDFLARRGCHGALLLGTTGEGPSFAPEERRAILKAAVRVREKHPDFRLLAGTGTPSLEETIGLTRTAFDLGIDGVVVLPPYYYRNATDDGLYAWFEGVIGRAVPTDGKLLGYHFPQVSGVGLSLELVRRLKDSHPTQFAGLKDSSGDLAHAETLAEVLPKDFVTLVGSDRIFSQALAGGAKGCITALSNLYSPEARRVWEAHQRDEQDENAQATLTAARTILESYPPAAPFLKAMLARRHGLPKWPVRPPLVVMEEKAEERAERELRGLGERDAVRE